MSRWKILAEVIAIFALSSALVCIALKTDVEPLKLGVGMKRLSGTVADGFVYMSPKEPFPRVSFSAFRIGKIKAGVISFAPFSTIEFDNLALNIPPSADKGTNFVPVNAGPPLAESSSDSADKHDILGVRWLATMAYGKSIGRIGGIKINGLSIGRMVGNELKPVIAARQLKSAGRKIIVEGLYVHNADGEKFVGRAELVTKPVPTIIWHDGRLELPEIPLIFGKRRGLSPFGSFGFRKVAKIDD